MTKKKNVKSQIATYVKRIYDKSIPLLLLESVVLIFVAAFMLIKPLVAMGVITVVFGLTLVFIGLYRTIAGFVVSGTRGGGWMDVGFGVLDIIVGILFLIYPVASAVGLAYIFIVWFVIKSVQALIFAFNMWRARFGHYVINFIVSLVMVGLAIVLLFFPAVGAVALIYYMAVALLCYAVADLYMYLEFRRLRGLDAE